MTIALGSLDSEGVQLAQPVRTQYILIMTNVDEIASLCLIINESLCSNLFQFAPKAVPSATPTAFSFLQLGTPNLIFFANLQ